VAKDDEIFPRDAFGIDDFQHEGLIPGLEEGEAVPDTVDGFVAAPRPVRIRPKPDPDSWADLDATTGTDQDDAVNQWAWVHEEPETPAAPDIGHCHVTAVLVSLDAERWLGETLAGLSALDPRPNRIIAIDNGSSDGTPALLQRAVEQGTLDAVYRGRHGRGFGAAVRLALRLDARAGHRLDDSDDSWLWLLHDDAVPHPDALRHLLEHVVSDPGVDVTGPKLLLPADGRWAAAGPPISELGVSISGTGRRELMLDRGELDQGQRDTPREVLGVSTCGLLVRTRVWEQVGGLDPGIPVFRDGVEFGWRCHRLGYRVSTTPRAEITHRQVGRAGLRPRGLGGRHPGKLDRHLGLLVVAGHAHPVLVPLVWVRLVWGSLLRAFGYLLGKAPRRALDEVRAVAGFAAHPGRIRALRRRIAARPVVRGSAKVVRRLRPPWWSSLSLMGEAVSGVVSDRYRSVAGELDSASLDELTGDDFAATGEEEPRRPWLSPIVLTVVLSVVASVVAARTLLGTGSLVSSALLPAPALGDLWRSVWTPVPGAPGGNGLPWLTLSAVASTVLAGRPEWFVTLLIGLVVPFSLISAYSLARHAVHDRRLRWWAALTYAVLPVVLGGTNQGRLAICLVAVLLPQLALAARAIAVRRTRTAEAWRGGWAAAALLTVLIAFEPVLFVVAVVLGAAGALWLRRSPRKVGRIGIALAVPVVLWAPWWIPLAARPAAAWGRLLSGPDAALTMPGPAAAAWQLLLGRETGPGLPPLALSIALVGVIWLTAFAALVREPRDRVVLAGWITAVVALGTAVVVSRLIVQVPPAGAETRPWTGSLLLIGFAALLLAAGTGLDGLAGQVQARSFSWVQPAVVLSGVLALVVTLTGCAWWVTAGLAGPIERQSLAAVPPYVRSAMVAPSGVRVLAIELRGRRAQYAVLYDEQLRWGDADRGFAFGAATEPVQRTRDLTLRLVAGSADEGIATELRDLGIGYVWVRGAGLVEQARIDNTPGLGAASELGRVVIWPVEGVTTRAAVVSTDGERTAVGSTGTVLPAGSPARQLRLAEAADRRWWATLDGRELTPVPLDWQQGFVVGGRSGELRYGLRTPASWLLVVQGLLLVVVVVLAAPAIRRPEVRDPTRAARRSARVVGGSR
jgi:GT2 family glycosyltransferase